MSAGICIMNRNAIAMAADSAVTVGDHIAIHNSANKLFSLSKIAPVGAIIYANSSFMDVPMEIIVKEYKKCLKTKSFLTLQEYFDDFIAFLEKNISYFRFEQNEENYVKDAFLDLIHGLLSDYNQFTIDELKKKSLLNLDSEGQRKVAQQAVNQTLSFIDNQKLISGSSHKDYITQKYKPLFEDILKKSPQFSWLNDIQVQSLLDKIVGLYDTEFERSGYVGMAIAGYGDNEIFPHMIHLHLSGVINGKTKYNIIETVEIDEKRIASIIPLAQTDVIQTFLFGINDQFIDDLAQEIPTQIHECIKKMDSIYFVSGDNDVVHKELHGVTEKIIQHMTETARNNYMKPIIQSVATLPIEELALLAESMINITSVRRKVAIDRNIGTVGGPIDVSIISKGDGFIWLKRKHYFDRKYNPQFFYSHYEKNEQNDTREYENNEE